MLPLLATEGSAPVGEDHLALFPCDQIRQMVETAPEMLSNKSNL